MKKYKTSSILFFLLTLLTCSLTIYGTINRINVAATVAEDIHSSDNSSIKLDSRKKEFQNTIKKINLDKYKIRLNKGDTRTLTARYKNKTLEGLVWTSKDPSIARVNSKGSVIGRKNGVTYVYCSTISGKVTARCKVEVRKVKYIAFTFDDGPGIYTNKLLDYLEKYNSQATFFVLGNRVNSYKKELMREYSLGCEIGNHSYGHAQFTKLSNAKIKYEIQRTDYNIKNVIGVGSTLLRPPYGSYNKKVSKIAKTPMIYWTIDMQDWKHQNKKYVYKTILKSAGDGQMILLHDIHETTVNGFIKALPKLRKKGYELVTVSELFKLKGKKLKIGKMHYNAK